jgi:hypothetical protein
MYIKLMLTCFLKNLNNVESCTPLDAQTLNPDNKMEMILINKMTFKILNRFKVCVKNKTYEMGMIHFQIRFNGVCVVI